MDRSHVGSLRSMEDEVKDLETETLIHSYTVLHSVQTGGLQKRFQPFFSIEVPKHSIVTRPGVLPQSCTPWMKGTSV